MTGQRAHVQRSSAPEAAAGSVRVSAYLIFSSYAVIDLDADQGMNKWIMNQRLPLGLSLRLFHALTTLNPWHFLWISIVLSEVLTALMGLLLKGSVTYDYLVTGGVVSLIVAGIVIFLLKITMQVRVDNDVLRAEIERQRETAEGLSKALDFQSLLMETIPDLLFVLNPAGTLVKWNAKAEETTGYSRSELTGQHAFSFIPEEDMDAARQGLEEAREKGTASRELRLVTKDGRRIIHRFDGAAIHDAGGRFMGYVGIGRDISNLKKMEEEMRHAQKIESLSVLAGGIVHDFNNLLTAVKENVHLAIMHADQREILRKALQEARKAADQAKDLIKRLSAFSQEGLPSKKLTALDSIITRYAAMATHDSRVSCSFTIARDLWNAEVDEGQIGKVISSIVLNAVEAMPRGGTVTITADNIEVSPETVLPLSANRCVRISVSDTGPGIPEKYLSKIFDPYFTTKQQGSGLGLAISYAIIKNHNGHIGVESTPGKGTVFHIYLPARNPHAPRKAAPRSGRLS